MSQLLVQARSPPGRGSWDIDGAETTICQSSDVYVGVRLSSERELESFANEVSGNKIKIKTQTRARIDAAAARTRPSARVPRPDQLVSEGGLPCIQQLINNILRALKYWQLRISAEIRLVFQSSSVCFNFPVDVMQRDVWRACLVRPRRAPVIISRRQRQVAGRRPA